MTMVNIYDNLCPIFVDLPIWKSDTIHCTYSKSRPIQESSDSDPDGFYLDSCPTLENKSDPEPTLEKKNPDPDPT